MLGRVNLWPSGLPQTAPSADKMLARDKLANFLGELANVFSQDACDGGITEQALARDPVPLAGPRSAVTLCVVVWSHAGTSLGFHFCTL